MKDNFELLADLKANNKIPVVKYKSLRTGLTVTVAQVDGPVVNGYFCLATEAHDDDGLPHTLEHLIFLGSELYPYKGVLDLLANRCLSSGTNAWTDTDHTCYTMTTAGSQGFLNLLPIYLDHVLYPTLTPSGYITEVHHITGEGEDAGVVYCEMQGRENSGESRTHLEMLRAMYPGHCGYKSETGGIMKNLRESTSHQKVVDYHKEFYRPENLGVVITGQVDVQEVLDTVSKYEDRILTKGDREPFLRPWSGEVPKLELDKDLTVPYPADEEDNGMVYVAWRGPSAVTALYRMFATMVLMEYLTETSVSPLQARFVESDSPLASSVGYSFIENKESTVYLSFQNVPKDKIPLVGSELKTVLQEIVSGKVAWDRSRMSTVIQRRISEQMSQVENSPHDAVAFMVIGDILYGNNSDDLRVRLNSVQEFEKLAKEPDNFWIELIDTIMLKSSRVVTMGVPSIELQKQMRKDEEERIQKQKNYLGDDGLKLKQKDLDEAMEKNEEEAPEDVISAVPIPSAASIKFHPMTSYMTNDAAQKENFDLNKMPVFFKFDQVNSNFVYLTTIIDTNSIPQKLKLYLPLFLELILESPILEGDVEVPYEEVVAKLAEDTIISTFGLGMGGGRFLPGAFAQSATFFIQAEPSKYNLAVAWIRKLLYQSKITAERVKVLGTKMENSISELKRKGSKVVSIIMNSILLNQDSNYHASNMIRQQQFLKSLLKKLDCSPNEVLSDLEELRFHMTTPSNMMVHLATDLSLLSDPMTPWTTFLPPHVPKKVAQPQLIQEHIMVVPPPSHIIAGLGSCESSFLSRTAPSLTDPRHPDLAPVLLAIQYITQLEGPMWRQIRGAGLAYGYSIIVSTNKGQIYFTLFKATHPAKAYEEGKRIIMSHVEGTEPWDPLQVESAKSSLIFELIEKEKSIGDVVQESLLSFFKGIDRDYSRKFLELVNSVTLDDLNRVGKQYLAPLFSSQTRTAIVCNPSKVEDIVQEFKSKNVEFQVLNSVDDIINLNSH